MTSVKQIKPTKQQMDYALKRATANAEYWARWKIPPAPQQGDMAMSEEWNEEFRGMEIYEEIDNTEEIERSNIEIEKIKQQIRQERCEVVTLDDFRTIEVEDCDPNYRSHPTTASEISIHDSGNGYRWYVREFFEFDMTREPRFATAQEALDDLLACQEPLVRRTLAAVFPGKYEVTP